MFVSVWCPDWIWWSPPQTTDATFGAWFRTATTSLTPASFTSSHGSPRLITLCLQSLSVSSYLDLFVYNNRNSHLLLVMKLFSVLGAVSWRVPVGWMKSTASSLAMPPAWQPRRETQQWVSFLGKVLQGGPANFKINNKMFRVRVNLCGPDKRWQSEKQIDFQCQPAAL